jgi:radical SAM superfamily enzyme YgiQ (UPF0313 family)
MRITLLHPAPESQLQNHRSGNGHLGIGYLAAYLMARGNQVRVLDAKNSLVTDDTLRRHIGLFQPQLFGVTAMTHEVNAAAHACSVVKQSAADTWTIMGGPHTTALPERTLQEFPSVDITVAGEGEITLAELVRAYEVGACTSELADIRGIAFRDGSHIVRNGLRPWIEDLDGLPFPAWELFPKVYWPVMAARGCPFGCVFCMRVLGRRLRLRSVNSVLAEFDALEARTGQRSVWFQDETFGLNKHWADEFLERLTARNERKGWVWRWGGNSRANLADLGCYRRMKASGCHGVSFGVESGDEVILKRIMKGITPQMAIDAIAAAQKAGMTAAAFFILGHPGETWRTALKTVRLAARCRADSIAVGVMVPYPGTEVWHMAHNGEWGYKLLTEDWRCYDKYFGNALAVEGLSHRELELLQSLTYVWYYIYNRRFGELWQFVRRFHSEAWAMLKRLLMPARAATADEQLSKPSPGRTPTPALRKVS